MGANGMTAKAEVEGAIVTLGGIEHFRKRAFRHPDVRYRAGFQASFLDRASGGGT
jgi:hypothetical protein